MRTHFSTVEDTLQKQISVLQVGDKIISVIKSDRMNDTVKQTKFEYKGLVTLDEMGGDDFFNRKF